MFLVLLSCSIFIYILVWFINSSFKIMGSVENFLQEVHSKEGYECLIMLCSAIFRVIDGSVC